MYDTLIVGGGPAGAAAAIAAARQGARTVLVEKHDILGGSGTAALVANFCKAHWDGRRFIIGGIFAEIREELIRRRALYTFPCPFESFVPEVYASLLAEKTRAAGGEIHFGTGVKSATAQGDGPITVQLDNGSTVVARTVVDTSGSLAVARALGAKANFGREDHAVMPLSFCYIIEGIDLGTVRRELPECVFHDKNLDEDYVVVSMQERVTAMVNREREAGRLSIPRDHISAVAAIPGRPGQAYVNYSRVTIADPNDPAQLAAAEAEGRKQIEDGVAFFRRCLPGFEKVKVREIARQIGIRESFHLDALHVLTGEEAEKCTQFADCIAQCCYPIDIHEPGKITTILKFFPEGMHFDIPWRTLIPKAGHPNVVVAGRCLGADHYAASSLRVAPTMIASGEAAGVTAALAASSGKAAREVGAEAVARLRETGAILE